MTTQSTTDSFSVYTDVPKSDFAREHSGGSESMDFKRKIFPREFVSREEYVKSRLSGPKSVLHLGCSDAPFTASLLEKKQLLHSDLLLLNPNVVGFDISLAGINFLRQAHPNAAFVHGDAEHLDASFPPGKFDLIVAGEVLEHLSNPGHFFEGCRHALADGGTLLLTVPNVFGIRRLIHSLFGVENYHPDHAFYFSENTIRTLAKRYDFSVHRAFYYASQPGPSWIKRVLYLMIETIPAWIFGKHFLDGIVLELKKRA